MKASAKTVATWLAVSLFLTSCGESENEKLGREKRERDLQREKLETELKGKAAHDLRDPSSAQFRNLRVVDGANGPYLCGEINAKNNSGGYVGFKPFAAYTSDPTSKMAQGARMPSVWICGMEGGNTGSLLDTMVAEKMCQKMMEDYGCFPPDVQDKTK